MRRPARTALGLGLSILAIAATFGGCASQDVNRISGKPNEYYRRGNVHDDTFPIGYGGYYRGGYRYGRPRY